MFMLKQRISLDIKMLVLHHFLIIGLFVAFTKIICFYSYSLIIYKCNSMLLLLCNFVAITT